MSVKQLVRTTAFRIAKNLGFHVTRYPPSDFTKDDLDIVRSVEPYTMTSPENIYALIQAVKYIVENKIPGEIVECGVWKGGSMMAIAKTLLMLKNTDKKLYLYDTYSGMTEPDDRDISYEGENALTNFRSRSEANGEGSKWANASLEDVKRAMLSTGYEVEKIHFVKGKVEDTIPKHSPNAISLLRLDTDWYESTRHELIHLFPKLSRKGVIIIDDYAHWLGSRKAVDEYISQNNISILLNRIDRSARLGVKI